MANKENRPESQSPDPELNRDDADARDTDLDRNEESPRSNNETVQSGDSSAIDPSNQMRVRSGSEAISHRNSVEESVWSCRLAASTAAVFCRNSRPTKMSPTRTAPEPISSITPRILSELFTLGFDSNMYVAA